MPYSTDNPPMLVVPALAGGYIGGSSIGGGNSWVYNSTNTMSSALSTGFISNGYDLGMRKYDACRIIDRASTLVADSFVSEASTSGPVTLTAFSTA